MLLSSNFVIEGLYLTESKSQRNSILIWNQHLTGESNRLSSNEGTDHDNVHFGQLEASSLDFPSRSDLSKTMTLIIGKKI